MGTYSAGALFWESIASDASRAEPSREARERRGNTEKAFTRAPGRSLNGAFMSDERPAHSLSPPGGEIRARTVSDFDSIRKGSDHFRRAPISPRRA